MEHKLTLGSLFDGSGGFPLGGLLCGIEPLWASEVEPFPIRVTTKRIPQMKHYGDINKLNGAELSPVDIITFGSPCQDMSVAGKREGMKHSEQGDEETTRSGLFYEAIRIIKEMRESTDGEYPKYAVWENVPGAFSSNKGHDFHAVLEALCSICDSTVSIPKPYDRKRADKLVWSGAGEIVGKNYSVAWRTLDAQYWGVPQRRKRIYLVADFTGRRAGEILFKPEGMSRDFTPSGSPWKGTAGNAEVSTGTSGGSVTCLNDQGGSVMSVTEDMTATLRAEEHGHQPCVMQASGFCTEHSAKSRGVGYEEERSPTLRAGVVPGTVLSFEPGAASRVGGHTDENISGSLRANTGDNQTAIAIENHPTDGRCRIEQYGKVQTLTSRMGTGGMNVPLVMNSPKTLKIRSGCEGGGKGALIQDAPIVSQPAYGIDRAAFNQGQNALYKPAIEEEQQPTLTAKGPGAVAQPASIYPHPNYIVRRLTPTECARLQGFPDHWCSDLGIENPTEEDITFWSEVWETHRKINGISKKPKSRKQIIKWLHAPHSDASEYKMWGNGVALPCVCFVLTGIVLSTQNTAD